MTAPKLQSLVLCADEQIVGVLQRLLQELAIGIERCLRADVAMELLARRKFDGIFADCDVPGGRDLLQSVRRSRANQRSIAFAIQSGTMSVGSAFEVGASFVLYKPISMERARRSLRAAHGLMMRERRRHFRQELDTRVYLKMERDQDLQAVIMDISAGGMLIKTPEPVVLKHDLLLRFSLPGISVFIETNGQVMWADKTGRAGIQFVSMPEVSQQLLDEWLLARARIEEPLASPGEAGKTPRAARYPATKAPEAESVEVEAAEAAGWRESRARATFRGEFKMRLIVLLIRSGKAIVIRGRCHDLSETGLGGDMEEELLVGDPVLLELSLPKLDEPLKLHAQVRHRADSHYGFELVGISAAQCQIIRRICESLPARE